MITLLTTLESDSELMEAICKTGLVSRILRSREDCEGINDESVLLINWPYILGADFIARQRIVLNVHNSLLPRYRGRHAFTWAILKGERKLGFSLHRVVAAVDAGEVFAQTVFPLDVKEDVNDAFRRGAALLNSWLPGALRDWVDGRLVATPQDETCASYFRRRTAEDNWLTSFDRAQEVRDFVRAVAPPYTSGAKCRFAAEHTLHVAAAQVSDSSVGGEPGRIMAVDSAGVDVACIEGVVRLVPVEREILEQLQVGERLEVKVT